MSSVVGAFPAFPFFLPLLMSIFKSMYSVFTLVIDVEKIAGAVRTEAFSLSSSPATSEASRKGGGVHDVKNGVNDELIVSPG